MINENFLFNLVTGVAKELEHQIENVLAIPESEKIEGFDNGKLVGLSRSLSLINTALGLYMQLNQVMKEKEK